MKMIIRIDIGQDKINDVIYKGLNFIIAILPPEVLLNMRNDEQRGERAAFLPLQLCHLGTHKEDAPSQINECISTRYKLCQHLILKTNL